jgi:hypothetical protein
LAASASHFRRRAAVPTNNSTLLTLAPGTFYSAMSNIDFEIGAKAIQRPLPFVSMSAQHAYLSHMDFHIGSGLAALTEIGNEAEDIHFYGGRYAYSHR